MIIKIYILRKQCCLSSRTKTTRFTSISILVNKTKNQKLKLNVLGTIMPIKTKTGTQKLTSDSTIGKRNRLSDHNLERDVLLKFHGLMVIMLYK